MQHATMKKITSAVLISGLTFALPAFAQPQGGAGTMGMGEKGEPDGQQTAGMLRDMAHEMNEMSGAMAKGGMSPQAMKKMSQEMKQLSGMMENMSGMTSKDAMINADKQKQMEQMRKQMDQMRKNVAVVPAKK